MTIDEATRLDVATGRARSNKITAGFTPGRFALRNTWIPVIHSCLLGNRPVRRALHGEPIYLAREGGVAVAYEDSPQDRERGRLRDSEFTAGSGRWPSPRDARLRVGVVRRQ